jgi:hypothetical protein
MADMRSEERILRGSLTGAYRNGYDVGLRGLPLVLPDTSEHDQWLTRNGYLDGLLDGAHEKE